MSIILITGGARSGKSRYAEELLHDKDAVGYIATAKAIDEDMVERIQRHRQQRPDHWPTIEKHCDFDQLPQIDTFHQCDTFLLDCMTMMVTNIMFDHDVDYDHCPQATIDQVELKIFDEVKKLIETMRQYQKNIVMVTNELGSGLVPAYRLGSIFRDIAGRVNQYLAKEADEVYCLISGLPLKLK